MAGGRQGLSEKMMSEYRAESNKETGHGIIWGKSDPGRGMASAKVLGCISGAKEGERSGGGRRGQGGDGAGQTGPCGHQKGFGLRSKWDGSHGRVLSTART